MTKPEKGDGRYADGPAAMHGSTNRTRGYRLCGSRASLLPITYI